MADLLPIWIIGVGPGDPKYITAYAASLIQAAGAVAGFQMPLETVARWINGERILLEYRTQEVSLHELSQRALMGQRCVICVQGDPSFSARELIERVQALWPRVDLVPGISSVQVLCAKAGLDMEDSLFITFHKRGDVQQDREELLQAALTGRRHLLVLPRPWDFMPADLARCLVEGGVSGDRVASVYQRLTLPEESVTTLPLKELAVTSAPFSDLSIFVLPALSGAA